MLSYTALKLEATSAWNSSKQSSRPGDWQIICETVAKPFRISLILKIQRGTFARRLPSGRWSIIDSAINEFPKQIVGQIVILESAMAHEWWGEEQPRLNVVRGYSGTIVRWDRKREITVDRNGDSRDCDCAVFPAAPPRVTYDPVWRHSDFIADVTMLREQEVRSG